MLALFHAEKRESSPFFQRAASSLRGGSYPLYRCWLPRRGRQKVFFIGCQTFQVSKNLEGLRQGKRTKNRNHQCTNLLTEKASPPEHCHPQKDNIIPHPSAVIPTIGGNCTCLKRR